MKFNLKKFKKPAMYFVGVVIGTYALVGLYSLIFEQDKLAIDRYNFEQLEKAKPILESIPTNARKFYTLKEFNEQYKADIKPIENCYHVANSNGEEKYIFGFELESWIYKLTYFSPSYSYPKYDVGYDKICDTGCYDYNEAKFRWTVSRPCEE